MTPYIATQILTARWARVIADVLSTMVYYGHDDDADVLRDYALAVEGVCPHREIYVDESGVEYCKHCCAYIYPTEETN